MLEVVGYLLNFSLDSAEFLLHSLHIKLGDLSYRLLDKLVDVLHHDLSLEYLLVGLHLCEHGSKLIFPALCIALENLVDLFLKEYLLKRTVVPVVLEFIESDLQLSSKQRLGVVGTVDEHVVYRKELRFMVYDDAGIRRN